LFADSKLFFFQSFAIIIIAWFGILTDAQRPGGGNQNNGGNSNGYIQTGASSDSSTGSSSSGHSSYYYFALTTLILFLLCLCSISIAMCKRAYFSGKCNACHGNNINGQPNTQSRWNFRRNKPNNNIINNDNNNNNIVVAVNAPNVSQKVNPYSELQEDENV